jgi:hypothetical protein
MVIEGGPRIRKFAALVLALVFAACAPPAKSPTVSLRLRGGPKDASVTVDDIPVGSLEVVRSRGVALPPGVHYVTIVAPGYLPFDRRVEAVGGPGAPVLLEVKMIEVPD